VAALNQAAAPAPEGAGEAGVEEDAASGEDPARSVGPLSSAEQAVRDVVAAGGAGLPSGLGLFLRGARVTEGPVGRVVVEMPNGPGHELLDSDPRARQALQRAVGQRLGRDVELDVRSAGERADQPRLTPDALRARQVDQLTGEEPALDRAVKEWDLEMLD
jgi:hypothetical protein